MGNQGHQGYELEDNSPTMYFAFPLMLRYTSKTSPHNLHPSLTKILVWIVKISLAQEKC